MKPITEGNDQLVLFKSHYRNELDGHSLTENK